MKNKGWFKKTKRWVKDLKGGLKNKDWFKN